MPGFPRVELVVEGPCEEHAHKVAAEEDGDNVLMGMRGKSTYGIGQNIGMKEARKKRIRFKRTLPNEITLLR